MAEEEMTEELWFNCNSPDAMLQELQERWRMHRTKSGRRRHRLFATACCRQIPGFATEPVPFALIEAVESYADGAISKAEMQIARDSYPCREFTGIIREDFDPILRRRILSAHPREEFARQAFAAMAWERPSSCVDCNHDAAAAIEGENMFVERRRQTKYLRDIFGNPFRPVPLDPRWLTSTVVDLVQAIYDERAFDRMPILADALMDAGCDSDEIILHCRGDGPHVSGCWVVDLLLGKT